MRMYVYVRNGEYDKEGECHRGVLNFGMTIACIVIPRFNRDVWLVKELGMIILWIVMPRF